MDIIIRTMSISDAETVANLSNQLGYKISVEQVKENIIKITSNNDSSAFVAADKNKVVAWISVALIISLTSLPLCEVRGLIVDENYRKKNVGKLLIEKSKEWSREKNCNCLRLRCNIKRSEAQNFYLHLGFIEKKQQKVFEIKF